MISVELLALEALQREERIYKADSIGTWTQLCQQKLTLH
jgi:hypothetical protein